MESFAVDAASLASPQDDRGEVTQIETDRPYNSARMASMRLRFNPKSDWPRRDADRT
jgi:hypothetical protein